MAKLSELGEGGHPTGTYFDTAAEPGKFCVIVLNQMEASQYRLQQDFDSLSEAIAAAKSRASNSVVTDVYDEHGVVKAQFGEPWNDHVSGE